MAKTKMEDMKAGTEEIGASEQKAIRGGKGRDGPSFTTLAQPLASAKPNLSADAQPIASDVSQTSTASPILRKR